MNNIRGWLAVGVLGAFLALFVSVLPLQVVLLVGGWFALMGALVWSVMHLVLNGPPWRR